MSDHIFKSHNKTLLLYHLVFPLKYRLKAISNEVGVSLKNICLNISYRYEIEFVEIGYEQDHVHFLDTTNINRTQVSKFTFYEIKKSQNQRFWLCKLFALFYQLVI